MSMTQSTTQALEEYSQITYKLYTKGRVKREQGLDQWISIALNNEKLNRDVGWLMPESFWKGWERVLIALVNEQYNSEV